jgi:hypothetical protein
MFGLPDKLSSTVFYFWHQVLSSPIAGLVPQTKTSFVTAKHYK